MDVGCFCVCARVSLYNRISGGLSFGGVLRQEYSEGPPFFPWGHGFFFSYIGAPVGSPRARSPEAPPHWPPLYNPPLNRIMIRVSAVGCRQPTWQAALPSVSFVVRAICFFFFYFRFSSAKWETALYQKWMSWMGKTPCMWIIITHYTHYLCAVVLCGASAIICLFGADVRLLAHIRNFGDCI